VHAVAHVSPGCDVPPATGCLHRPAHTWCISTAQTASPPSGIERRTSARIQASLHCVCVLCVCVCVRARARAQLAHDAGPQPRFNLSLLKSLSVLVVPFFTATTLRETQMHTHTLHPHTNSHTNITPSHTCTHLTLMHSPLTHAHTHLTPSHTCTHTFFTAIP
jgi:hypothetical protein